MATAINSLRLASSFNWDIENTTTFGTTDSSGSDAPSSTENSYTHGTGAGQADQVYILKSTLAASANLDIDLSGSLTDAFGNALVAVRLKAVYFRQIASAGNTGTHCLVGNAVANDIVSWSIPVRRGGFCSIVAPDATGLATVAAGTSDLFRITNGDGTNPVEFFLALVCASA